jgi:hypothetical protein
VVPDGLPVLSAGAHRSPHDGGCVMEWTSLLAGERWSDRPRCTHPVLARLARGVNDAVGDGARQRLAPLAATLVGMTSDDPRWAREIGLLAAGRALPRARTPELGRGLAVAVLHLDRGLAPYDGRGPSAVLRPASGAVLEAVPEHAAWARWWTGRTTVPASGWDDLAEAAVDRAVQVLADRPEELLVLLEDAVTVCAALRRRDPRSEGVGGARASRAGRRTVVALG